VGKAGYRTKTCQFFKQGRCLRGSACTFSHGEEDPQARNEGRFDEPRYMDPLRPGPGFPGFLDAGGFPANLSFTGLGGAPGLPSALQGPALQSVAGRLLAGDFVGRDLPFGAAGLDPILAQQLAANITGPFGSQLGVGPDGSNLQQLLMNIQNMQSMQNLFQQSQANTSNAISGVGTPLAQQLSSSGRPSFRAPSQENLQNLRSSSLDLQIKAKEVKIFTDDMSDIARGNPKLEQAFVDLRENIDALEPLVKKITKIIQWIVQEGVLS